MNLYQDHSHFCISSILCYVDTNYKDKLQQYQQKSKLTIPKYIPLEQEDKTFKAQVSVPLPDGGAKQFECEASYKKKKDAEQAAARKACEAFDILDEVKVSSIKETSKADTGANPNPHEVKVSKVKETSKAMTDAGENPNPHEVKVSKDKETSKAMADAGANPNPHEVKVSKVKGTSKAKTDAGANPNPHEPAGAHGKPIKVY